MTMPLAIRRPAVSGRLLQVFCIALCSQLIAGCGAPSPFEPFTEQRYNALQASGQPLLIDVHATWCPTCKKQGEILSAFLAENPQCKLSVLSVDFDEQKPWVAHFEAPRQSTLVLFRGQEKRWFSVAETRAEVIHAALREHLPGCGKA